jgi:excisionase family DNA binding protein
VRGNRSTDAGRRRVVASGSHIWQMVMEVIMSITDVDAWWTRREAAVYARVSEATIGREVRNSRLRHVRVGGRRALRFRREWIDDWLAGTLPVVGASSRENSVWAARSIPTDRRP